MADLWTNLLQQEQVGALDNFFELGGDSLLATQLMARVREQFQVEVPLRSLFQSPTVETIANAIAEGLAAQVDESLLADIAQSESLMSSRRGNHE